MKIAESRIRKIIIEELLREFSRTPTPSEVRAAINVVKTFNTATSVKNVTPAGLGVSILTAVGIEAALWFLDSDHAKDILSIDEINSAVEEINTGTVDAVDTDTDAAAARSTLKTFESLKEDQGVYVKIEQKSSAPSARITVYRQNVWEDEDAKETLAEILIARKAKNPASRSGPCLGALSVRWSKALPGWGPMAYDIAIEVASILAKGLISDSNGVSPSAKAVWDTYLATGTLATSPASLNISDLDDAYTKFITPDNTSDDCQRIPVRTHYPSYWGNPESYWQTPEEGFPSDLPDANMNNNFGDPPVGAESPTEFTQDFQNFYRETGITKMFSIDGHPTIDKLRSAGRLEVTHPGLQHL